MALTIQMRRGTASQWTASNPVLAQGEFGYETDTLKFKLGDGTSAWASLSYSSIPSTAIASSIVTAKGDILAATSNGNITRLAVGTDGQALVADSSTGTGLRWGSVSAIGDDDQVVLAARVFS